MKRFQEFITEGRDAPLYHATNVTRALLILSDNILKRTDQNYGDDERSVSFTRDLKTAWYHGRQMHVDTFNIVIFEVSQTKLAQNYKIEPFQFWSQSTRNELDRIDKARLDKKDIANNPDMYNEFEERVIGKDITNFDRYIEKVIVYSPTTLNTFNKMQKQRYDDIFLKNPKLYFYSTKKFANR